MVAVALMSSSSCGLLTISTRLAVFRGGMAQWTSCRRSRITDTILREWNKFRLWAMARSANFWAEVDSF